MRLRLRRFTVRRLMALVVLMAVLIWGVQTAWRWRVYRRATLRHSYAEQAAINSAVDAERRITEANRWPIYASNPGTRFMYNGRELTRAEAEAEDEKWVALWAAKAAELRGRAVYHGKLRRKYEWAVRYPWIAVEPDPRPPSRGQWALPHHPRIKGLKDEGGEAKSADIGAVRPLPSGQRRGRLRVDAAWAMVRQRGSATMRGRLAPLAIVLIAVSLAGAALRWFIEPPANTYDRTARVLAERQAVERSLQLAYLALASAGVVLMLADRWPTRAAGGLLTIASGMLANLPGAFWLSGLLIGFPLLLAAAIMARFGRAGDSA